MGKDCTVRTWRTAVVHSPGLGTNFRVSIAGQLEFRRQSRRPHVSNDRGLLTHLLCKLSLNQTNC